MATVKVNVSEARELLAADKGGTSDAFVIIELVDSTSKKPLNGRSHKTDVVKKSLNPIWSKGSVIWNDVAEDLSTLALKVAVFDNDMMSREALGVVTIPFSASTKTENGLVDWYPLSDAAKMKAGSASGAVKVSFQVEPSSAAAMDAAPASTKVLSAPAEVETAIAPTATAPTEIAFSSGATEFTSKSDSSASASSQEASSRPSSRGGTTNSGKGTVWVNVMEARDLMAADKSGTSDAYATYELIDTATGKSAKRLRKQKTEVVRKSLAPAWKNGAMMWENVAEDLETLSLKVTVFDSDTMSSEALGEAVVPLSVCPGQSQAEVVEWYALTDAAKMKAGSATGAVRVSLSAAASAEDLLSSVNAEKGTAVDGSLRPLPKPDASEGASSLEASSRPSSRGGTTNSGKGTVWVNVMEARDLMAADKSGTSDAYATYELIDTATGKSAKRLRKQKTEVVRKSLAPAWKNGAMMWENVAEDLETLSLKVTVFDSDTMSSEALGEAVVPLSVCLGQSQAEVVEWYALTDAAKMKAGSATGAVRVSLSAAVSAEDLLSSVDATEAAVDNASRPSSRGGTASGKGTVWVNVMEARDLMAADKSGTSDAYATYELIDTATGKSAKRLRKQKTEVVRKSLAPAWKNGAMMWENVAEDLETLSLKVTVFDSDTMSSEALGEAVVPLSVCLGQSQAEVVEWYALTDAAKMKAGSATGAVRVSLSAAASAEDLLSVKANSRPASSSSSRPSTSGSPKGLVWISVFEARDLMAADKGETSDPYATFELVQSETGKSLKKARKKKTNAVKKTLNPVWSDGEVTWADVDEDLASLSLKVTVLDSDTMSSEALGGVTVPLNAFLGQTTDIIEWYPLSDVGEMKAGSAMGAVRIGLKVQSPPKATEDRPISPPPGARPKTAPFRHTVAMKVLEAKELAAADKGGTSDPYAIVELVDASTGKPLKKPRKRKTKTCSKTLQPVWREAVTWADLTEEVANVLVKVTVYDADNFSSQALGMCTVPLSWGTGPKGSGAQWYPLAAVGKANSGGVMASGVVMLDFSVVRVEGKKGGKSIEKPKREFTWEDRLDACKSGGKKRFDLSRLQLVTKFGEFPAQIVSPSLGLGQTLTALNLKGNGLSVLPPFLSTAFPKLKSLVLSNNFLRTLPDDIALLVNLEVLAIDRNKFVALPPVLFSDALCDSLVSLNAQGNQLSSLPPDVQKWLGLEHLLLKDNLLTAERLPAAALSTLASDGSLVNLELDGNPCMRGTPFVLPLPENAYGGNGSGAGYKKGADKAAKKGEKSAPVWEPPNPVSELLDSRSLFRSKLQRQVAMQRAVALRARLAARRADLVFEE